MATINQQKIGSVPSLAAGGTTTFTWNNYPENTVLGYFAVPVPPPAAGPHGTSLGTVEITRVAVTYQRDNYNGDRRHVDIDVKNPGTHATGFDLWESWIS
jgi:hypothetical protein